MGRGPCPMKARFFMCGFRFLMVVLVACLSLFASCFSDGEYPDDGEHDDQTESNLVMGVEGGPCREDESCDHDLYCSDEMICTREISQVKSDRCPEDGMAFISSHGDVEFYPNVGWRYFFVGVGDDDCNYNWCKFSKPRHRVKIEDGFCLDKKPFTNGDKAKLSQTKAFSDFKWPNKCQDAIFLGDKRPLVCVSWDEANEICRRQGKRLPTEDAWEYAARGMGVRKCQYGTKDCAVPDENNACWQDPQNLSRTGSCDVDRSPPNALDLYDMAGNVGY